MPYAQINNIEMYYERLGSGSPIIFLHSGFSRGILAFASQILDFQQQFNCYFPDFRGHGRTKSASLEWSTPQHAADIIALMDQLEIERAHLIGYGMGGGVAFYCAVNHHERITTLTSIGQCGFVAATGSEEFEPQVLIDNEKHDFITSIKERHFDAHQGNWQQFLQQKLTDWRKYPQLTDEQLQSISCPCLFIAGEHDVLAPEQDLQKITSLITNSNYVIVPGGSHRPHMIREQPIFVNDTILQFLARYTNS